MKVLRLSATIAGLALGAGLALAPPADAQVRVPPHVDRPAYGPGWDARGIWPRLQLQVDETRARGEVVRVWTSSLRHPEIDRHLQQAALNLRRAEQLINQRRSPALVESEVRDAQRHISNAELVANNAERELAQLRNDAQRRLQRAENLLARAYVPAAESELAQARRMMQQAQRAEANRNYGRAFTLYDDVVQRSQRVIAELSRYDRPGYGAPNAQMQERLFRLQNRQRVVLQRAERRGDREAEQFAYTAATHLDQAERQLQRGNTQAASNQLRLAQRRLQRAAQALNTRPPQHRTSDYAAWERDWDEDWDDWDDDWDDDWY